MEQKYPGRAHRGLVKLFGQGLVIRQKKTKYDGKSYAWLLKNHISHFIITWKKGDSNPIFLG